mmetsp:Transcript_30122/g.41360  ORF Transcript_30122/g.41360 Transcript_30122/m.41360 type:complete len:322 (+) Transcript_30122:52-1017(+)
MIYSRATKSSIPLTVSGSPSYLPNNLSASPTDTLSFSRFNEVHIIQLNGSSVMKSIMDKARIHQVSFLELDGRWVLALASSAGLQVWSVTGDTILFQYSISQLPYLAESTDDKFMRGLAATPNALCVGTSIGSVHAFLCKSVTSNSWDATLGFNMEPDHYPITTLASFQNILAVANDSGKIFGYDSFDAYVQVFSFSGFGYPCTAIVQRENVLIAGYSSGHLRLFRTDIQELAIEVTAHTRAISGLAIHPALNILASVSPDQYLHVWEVPDFMSASSRDVSILYSDLIENKICTGVSFLSSERICVATFDDDEMVVYERNK